MRIAAVGLAVVAFGMMSWIATAFVPAVEHAEPQKVAQEGICTIPIFSSDGLWNACVDAFGQVNYLAPPDQPLTDNIFETLVYEASTHSGGLTRRVETSYVVSAGPIVSTAGDSTWTRLEKAGAPMSIEITNRMVNGPAGGVQVQIRCENKGPLPITCKLFYYCDFDISGTLLDDEATALFDPGTGRLVAIEQTDFLPPNKPLWFGGCPNYKSWEINFFPLLRDKLDFGVPQLLSADPTLPGAADHSAALAGDEVVLEPGQSSTMEVGIGGPGFSECKRKCPYDCDGSGDGIVGILDFLAVLAQWGIPGAPCDKTAGDLGVGILDFLAVLSAWGPCPVNTVKCCLPIDLDAYCQDPTSDPPEACVDADSCAECATLGGLCVEECNLVDQTITVVDENAPSGAARHSTWTALVCAPKAPCVCGNFIDARFTSATPCGPGQGSHIEFGVGEIPSIPPGFFFAGSPPFAGLVCLKGEPLGDTPFGVFDIADTLIRRFEDPFQCTDPFPATAVIPIEIVALNLVSIDPINIGPTQWDVRVTLAPAPQLGVLQAEKLHANGGLFSSELPVVALISFALAGNPGMDLQFAVVGIPLTNGPTEWVHDVKLGTLAPEGPPSCFNPGIHEDNP